MRAAHAAAGAFFPPRGPRATSTVRRWPRSPCLAFRSPEADGSTDPEAGTVSWCVVALAPTSAARSRTGPLPDGEHIRPSRATVHTAPTPRGALMASPSPARAAPPAVTVSTATSEAPPPVGAGPQRPPSPARCPCSPPRSPASPRRPPTPRPAPPRPSSASPTSARTTPPTWTAPTTASSPPPRSTSPTSPTRSPCTAPCAPPSCPRRSTCARPTASAACSTSTRPRTAGPSPRYRSNSTWRLSQAKRSLSWMRSKHVQRPSRPMPHLRHRGRDGLLR